MHLDLRIVRKVYPCNVLTISLRPLRSTYHILMSSVVYDMLIIKNVHALLTIPKCYCLIRLWLWMMGVLMGRIE